jgi:hypothetical protein
MQLVPHSRLQLQKQYLFGIASWLLCDVMTWLPALFASSSRSWTTRMLFGVTDGQRTIGFGEQQTACWESLQMRTAKGTECGVLFSPYSKN